jgi:hypothetical protein
MTLWYLIGAVVVLGIAILSVIGFSVGVASTPLQWAARFLPAVASLVACIAYCMAASRARLGFLAPVFFCLPLAALITLMLWPHVMSVRNSNFYTMLLTIYPVLTLFPAMAPSSSSTAKKSMSPRSTRCSRPARPRAGKSRASASMSGCRSPATAACA